MSNTSVTIYNEFVDSNLDKRYPLCDEGTGASSFVIPNSFMADLKVCIGTLDNAGESSYRYNTYVSQIRVYADYIYVELSASSGVIACSDPIPTDLRLSNTVEERTIMIRPTGTIPVNGTLIVGTCEDISRQIGVWDINKEQGWIFPANIIIVPDSITGIRVNGTTVTGDVILQAGEGIEIDYDKDTNTITFQVAKDDRVLTDEDFMDLVVGAFGKPITHINGVTPDDTGNVQINPTDCLMVEVNPAAHTISFYNPCGPTCASEEFMEDTYTRISDLNRSAATLSSLYNSVANTLAQMGVRVSAVLEPRQ